MNKTRAPYFILTFGHEKTVCAMGAAFSNNQPEEATF